MSHYVIIETDEGFTVAAVPEGENAGDVARTHGGMLIDEGPYKRFEDAQEILLAMPNPYEVNKGSRL